MASSFVPALHCLHEVRWGRATAFAVFLIGFQIVYVVLTVRAG
ncbi:MAG: hypothetical protein ACE5OY_04775 [Candidatus Bathyarchaeia archaeon]